MTIITTTTTLLIEQSLSSGQALCPVYVCMFYLWPAKGLQRKTGSRLTTLTHKHFQFILLTFVSPVPFTSPPPILSLSLLSSSPSLPHVYTLHFKLRSCCKLKLHNHKKKKKSSPIYSISQKKLYYKMNPNSSVSSSVPNATKRLVSKRLVLQTNNDAHCLSE